MGCYTAIPLMNNMLYIAIDGEVLMNEGPAVITRTVAVNPFENISPSYEFYTTHLANPLNICFYTTSHINLLEIVPILIPPICNSEPTYHNLFINEKLRALICIKNVNDFTVALKPI
ncbi:hypothetical protein FQR65_LT08244 [Abscondita terminalis]|nr:hypothetical protein FQR65_LT08244 [Abscondita terminalis]